MCTLMMLTHAKFSLIIRLQISNQRARIFLGIVQCFKTVNTIKKRKQNSSRRPKYIMILYNEQRPEIQTKSLQNRLNSPHIPPPPAWSVELDKRQFSEKLSSVDNLSFVELWQEFKIPAPNTTYKEVKKNNIKKSVANNSYLRRNSNWIVPTFEISYGCQWIPKE